MSYGSRYPFTAHPKLDPRTGTLHYFGYSVQETPNCMYGQLDSKGKRTKWMEIPLRVPIMMHDFAVGGGYAVFIDHPLVWDLELLMKEKRMPLKFDKSLPWSIGLLLTTAKSAEEMTWFELPPHVIMHVSNAWEEGEKVVLYAVSYTGYDLDYFGVDFESKL